MKIKCNLETYRTWESHPFTEILRQVIKAKQIEEGFDLVNVPDGTMEEEGMRLRQYTSRQRAFNELMDLDLKEMILDRYIEWQE